ncbi:MAG TPA: 1-(5-phosphoribosyl)-5-[(5-phosphoribosylamino)methylideneamino]imidazole-4-carboxamide isomerase [Thermomicrobiales bacterium]|nr:1-(5-phosphoribosyl)-5-[(5-phosphoribosylamino)methylideneamino]imidazole-4-carboxamide isomerase [Thermomicrobiales bacterium]
MIVLPAIDLRGGRCVRLFQGDYSQETVFSDDPVAVARGWQAAGARMLHVVDVDGARDGLPAQRGTIARIVSALDIPVQVGGGIRTREHALALLGDGVVRVVLGTAAVEAPALVDALLVEAGPERVVVGVDARDGLVATRGWTETSGVPAEELVRDMRARGVRRVVYTDISRDGTLDAPNVEATARIATLGVGVIASGGVSRREHLDLLAAVPGVEAAIVGRALYTGHVRLEGDDWVVEPGTGVGEHERTV